MVISCKHIIATSLLFASAALAQNNRSAVSVLGNDANPCTTTSPCRSFGVAIAHTNGGGEVIAFDSGGYGPFTVTTPVSVIGAPGIHAAITQTAGDGVAVSTASGDKVKIRNLTITVGVYACPASTVRVGYSAVTDKGQYGFQQAGTSVLASMGNNLVAGNGFDKISDTSGTISPAAVH